MLLKYHEELIKIINKLQYFEDNSFISEYINLDLLEKGLHYPDVPCGKLINANGNTKWLEYNPCKTFFPLANLFLDNISSSIGLTEIVNSHRGRQAIGHSMTPNPKYTMIEIRQKILRRLEILYMLALEDNSLIKEYNDGICKSCIKNCKNDTCIKNCKNDTCIKNCKNDDCIKICNVEKCNICYILDKGKFRSDKKYTCPKPQPNIFWIGMIIHCIDDSYSRAHTLREFKENNINHHRECLNLPNTPDDGELKGGSDKFTQKEKTHISAYVIKLIGDSIEKLEEEKTEINIQQILNKVKILHGNNKEMGINYLEKDVAELIKKNPNDIEHLLKLIKFFKDNKKKINDIFKDNIPSNELRDVKDENIKMSVLDMNKQIVKPENYPYIISFRYVPHQTNCGKTFHMSYDKKKPTCESYLEYFKIKNAEDILEMYKRHVKNIGKDNIGIDNKIREFIIYMANNVFYIKDEYKNNPSAIKCDEFEKCECYLSKDNIPDKNVNVYDLHKIMIKKYHNTKKEDEKNKMLYEKYQKYKMKYLKLKSNELFSFY